jgi:hypothetical protein
MQASEFNECLEDFWFYRFNIIIIHENVSEFIQIRKFSAPKCGYAVVGKADNSSISADATGYGCKVGAPASGLLEAARTFIGTCDHCSHLEDAQKGSDPRTESVCDHSSCNI